MNTVGRNTIAGELLRGFVERVENIQAQIKDLGKDKAVVMAEAKVANLQPKGISCIVKKRKMKPSERAEAEALEDMYSAISPTPDPICVDCTYVGLTERGVTLGDKSRFPEDIDEFAKLDGFGSYSAMWKWFSNRYKTTSFTGHIIRWRLD